MSSLLIGIALGVVAVAAFAFVRAGFRVENGNIGVLSVFGQLVLDELGSAKRGSAAEWQRGVTDGKKVRTFGPGLHWKAPWAQVTHVSLAERSLSVGAVVDHAAPSGRGQASAIEVLASDGTRIRVNARLRFRVEADRVGAFLVDSKHAIEHLSGLFTLVVREQIARFEQKPDELSAYTALRLRMNELQQRTLDALSTQALTEYGIVVSAVDLLQIDPPEELVDALNAVITAESEANALVARTELSSQQRVLSAEQSVAIANARALATESEIRTIGAELAILAEQGVLRDYVARRRAEVMGGSRRVYLNHQPTLRS